jgi:hypothetical protein
MAILLVGPLQDGLSPQRSCACRMVPLARPLATQPYASRPHAPISSVPLPHLGPCGRLLAPPNTAPAEFASVAQGCCREALGSRVQLNGYWKSLATASEAWPQRGMPLVAVFAGKRHPPRPPSPPLALRAGSSGAVCDVDWPASAPMVPCRRACKMDCSVQRCTKALSSFRAAVRAGMQQLQQRHRLLA